MSWDVGAWVVNTLKKLIENHGVQEFTADGTFTVPAGVYKIWVTACGAGSGGCSASTGNTSVEYMNGAGGNGGMCIIREPFAVTPGEEIAITIGTGGAKGTGSAGIGKAGGSTVIGSLVTLLGGAAQSGWCYGNGVKRLGGGRGGRGGAYDYSDGVYDPAECGGDGSRGSGGHNGDNDAGAGGGGGGSLGNGGNGADSDNGTDATAAGYGGGGGGGADDGTAYAASKGGNGYVRIEW